MTELDFEELDKAVSDLMKDTGADQADVPATAPVVDSPTPAVSVDATAVSQPDSSIAQPAASPAAVVVKNRGRFMDVKPNANGTPPSLAPKPAVAMPAPVDTTPVNEAPAEAPAEPIVTLDTPTEPQPAEAAKADATSVGDYAANPVAIGEQQSQGETTEFPEAKTEERPGEDGSANSFTMPDPIDMASAAEKKPEDELSSVMTPVPDAQPSESATPETGAGEAEQKAEGEDQPEQAMNSPFIPDAKVEKRPLGGAASDVATEEKPAEAAEQPEAVPAPLPRELGSDLMSLETDPGNAAANANKKDDAPKEPAKAESAEPQKAPEQPAAPAPSQGSADASGTIFDTAGYHNMPVTKPAKKKHGWMIIIWILVLLIVGACAGAAYFYFTTQ